MTSAHVVEVTTANFQSVIEASMQQPVLLDFWASWCGPCRTLTPVLEKLVAEFAGGFVLGKVDTEAQQELAYAFRVQGIPYCVLLEGGRPVDAFQGALREAEVRQFLQRNGVSVLAVQQPEAPPPDPQSPAALLQRARQAAARGRTAEALQALDAFPEDDAAIDAARRLRDGLAFLQAELRQGTPGAEGLLAEARQRFVAGEVEPAMALILQATAADKEFRGGLPRRAMLLCFAVLGDEDERCDSYRRQLATLLY